MLTTCGLESVNKVPKFSLFSVYKSKGGTNETGTKYEKTNTISND